MGRKKKYATHDSASRLYRIFYNMKARCDKPNDPWYSHYGARGITVCSEWQDYSVFRQWALDNGYSETLTIDRKNNDLGYSPNNCHWVTMTYQQRNKRARTGCASIYTGVTYIRKTNRWKSLITVNKQRVVIGSFATVTEAAQARDNYILNNNLEGFTLNFSV